MSRCVLRIYDDLVCSVCLEPPVAVAQSLASAENIWLRSDIATMVH